MNLIKDKYNSLCTNTCNGKNSSDIKEHLPTLYYYATQSNSVFETGVRNCISSWAFAYGLLNGLTNTTSFEKKKLLMNDINSCDISELISVCESSGLQIEINFIQKNNLEIEFDNNYDLTFIDTWHVYGQLKRELNIFSKYTNKYIIMHDTTIDAIYGETIRNGWNALAQSKLTGIPVDEINKGLIPAIEEFLIDNPSWYLKERFTNNNGLIILAKYN